MIKITINIRIFLVISIMALALPAYSPPGIEYNLAEQSIPEPDDTEKNWEYLYQAICQVESKGNNRAINVNTGARGIIQIMPLGKGGYLDEYNRLTHEGLQDVDLDCPITSRKIFDKVQSTQNPDRDIEKAIKIHNYGGGELYKFEILMNYWKIKFEANEKDKDHTNSSSDYSHNKHHSSNKPIKRG